MALLQRFDLDLSPTELKRRWRSFHHNIHVASGSPLRRTGARILGEGTRRETFFRLLFAPFLRGLRRRRATSLVHTPLETGDAFPYNYRPRSLNYEQELTSLHVDDSDVVVVVIDEARATPEELANQLNDILNETSDEWLFLVDASLDDVRRRYSVATLLTHATKDDDVVFADETGLDEHSPVLKSPAVGPHTLLSYNAVGRPALLRVETVFQVGGFDPDAGWAFEHDVYLRLVEAHARFRHVPLVLPAGRSALDFSAHHINASSVRAVERAIARRGATGVVSEGALPGLVRWELTVPTPAPSIDIIIPTRDRIDLVRRCIDSVESKSTYPNYEIIILDNDSVQPDSHAYFNATPHSVVPCPGPFNYAAIVNRGVAHSGADFIVTLNNDTVIVTPDWLERLVALASLPDVGVVGPALVNQRGRHEHDGIVIAPYPQHLLTDTNYRHLDHFALATRDVAAVTGAVQMVRRTFWNELGGMDKELAVVMGDVDLCLRSLVAGRYVVFTPDVQLVHEASSSRGGLDPLDDRNAFVQRWDIFGGFGDPFFPESLALLGDHVVYVEH